MTLTTYDNLEQGSDLWHDLRRGMITASAIGKLITPTLKVADNDTSRGLLDTLAAERITGTTQETRMTDDMWRGVNCEPIAREIYSENYAPATEVGFMVREENGWQLGYSPDGLVGDDGLIEIKSPRAKGHLSTILTGAVPAYYMAQCQTGLFVTGRKWIDYVSFYGGMPLWVQRVLPDPAWHVAIAAAVENAESVIGQKVADYEQATKGLVQTEPIPELFPEVVI